MINITYEPSTYTLTAKGHAGGKKGKDLVCAAVSTLFYTLAASIMESSVMLEEEPIFKDDDDAEEKIISCKPKKGSEGNIQRSFWTILVGIRHLQAQFPEKVYLFIA